MELNQCINYLLTTAQHVVFQKMSARLSVYDVTPVQYGVLYCLWELNLSNPKEIAETLHLENSTISGVLDRLEKKELIERNLSKEDRRCVEVKATSKADELKRGVIETVDEVNREVMSEFSPEHSAELKDYLRQIAGIN